MVLAEAVTTTMFFLVFWGGIFSGFPEMIHRAGLLTGQMPFIIKPLKAKAVKTISKLLTKFKVK